MNALYLSLLLASTAAMVAIDWRYRLFFWRTPVAAAIVLALGVAFLTAWDAFGIVFGVFFVGTTSFMTGVLVAPELPLEEPFFLLFLCYLTMNACALLARWDAHRQARRGRARRVEEARP